MKEEEINSEVKYEAFSAIPDGEFHTNPCPFCGGKPKQQSATDGGSQVVCSDCGVMTKSFFDIKFAWLMWNYRTRLNPPYYRYDNNA